MPGNRRVILLGWFKRQRNKLTLAVTLLCVTKFDGQRPL